MTPLWLVLIFLGLLYVLYFGLLTRPERSIYAFLGVWIAFPKGVEKLPVIGNLGFDGLAIFTVVETIATLAILLQLVHARRTSSEGHGFGTLKAICLLFLVTLVVSNLISSVAREYALYPEIGTGLLSAGGRTLAMTQLNLLAAAASAVIWMYGAVTFLRGIRQIQILLAILVVSGIELVAESLVLNVLGLVPVYSERTISANWKFDSLAMGGAQMTAVFVVLAIYSVLYFALARGQKFLLLLIPLLMFALALSLQRSLILGFSVSLVFFLWWTMPAKYRLVYIATFPLVVTVMFTFGSNAIDAAERVDRSRGRGYLSVGGIQSRIATDIRATEIAAALPLGVGVGAGERYTSSSVPSFMPLPDYEATELYYDRLVSAEHRTNAHNVYLNFIVESGVLGLLALGAFVLAIWKNFRRFRRFAGRVGENRELFLAQCATYAVLIFLGLHYLFTTAPEAYFVWVFLLFLTFMLRDLQPAADQRGDRVGPMGNPPRNEQFHRLNIG